MALVRNVPVACVVATGLVGCIAALAGRDADEAFIFQQRNPRQLQPAAVERIVRRAPEPRGDNTERGIDARCRARGRRGLQNPWLCTVRYRSGLRVTLVLRIREDGSYVGRYPDGGATASGCCIAIPGLQTENRY